MKSDDVGFPTVYRITYASALELFIFYFFFFYFFFFFKFQSGLLLEDSMITLKIWKTENWTVALKSSTLKSEMGMVNPTVNLRILV